MRIALFLVFIFSSFLALNISADQFDEQTSSKIIQEAEKKYKEVLKVKNAWRDTKKIIKNAKKAHKEQNYEKSVTLAKKALNEANMAYEHTRSKRINIVF